MTSDPGLNSGHAAGHDWLTPRARGPVRAVVRLPGSKSMTNRALVLAALADGPTVITGPLAARDTALMAGALRALGCAITETPGSWLVEPASAVAPERAGSGQPGRPGVTIDVGNAGTVLRFIPPVAALTSADVTFRGDPRASERPVRPLLTALRSMGATISDTGTGALPFVVRGRGAVPGGTATMDASASSQLVSGLLLAAARFGAGAEVRHVGPALPSEPHIDMTVRMLRAAGVDVRADAGQHADGMTRRTWRVMPGPIRATKIDVEPDLSNAVPFLAAALATGGEVTVAAGRPTACSPPCGSSSCCGRWALTCG